jgi:NADPH:quinone reductase
MKASLYSRQGTVEVLELQEMPRPSPKAGEVLVRLHTSGINPADVKARQGVWGPMAFPQIIPHSDGAGIIEEVGEGVPRRRIGERVWVYNAQWGRPWGTAADYVALPDAQAVPMPESMSFEAGACLGIPALTAHRCVFADGPVAGKWVLVTGGAGSVGHYAVQFAKWGGARVITTVSSPAKAEHARTAHADAVLNYKTEGVVQRVLELTEGRGVDRVVEVEFGGNISVTEKVLKENAVIAAYASAAAPVPAIPYYPLMMKNTMIRLVLVYSMPPEARQKAIADVFQAHQAGVLHHAVGATYGLEHIAKAHQSVESGTALGNVVLRIAP